MEISSVYISWEDPSHETYFQVTRRRIAWTWLQPRMGAGYGVWVFSFFSFLFRGFLAEVCLSISGIDIYIYIYIIWIYIYIYILVYIYIYYLMFFQNGTHARAHPIIGLKIMKSHHRWERHVREPVGKLLPGLFFRSVTFVHNFIRLFLTG